MLKILKNHIYKNLNVGLISIYSLAIMKKDLNIFKEKGWIEYRKSINKYYKNLDENETVVLGIPKKADFNSIINKRIIGYETNIGTYGFGSPGFFGFKLDSNEENLLIYSIWGASEYILVDNKVIECNPFYSDKYYPLLTDKEDKLNKIIIDSIIISIKGIQDKIEMIIEKKSKKHKIEFFKNSEKLPPHGNGEKRKDAYVKGNINDYVLLIYEKSILHCYKKN